MLKSILIPRGIRPRIAKDHLGFDIAQIAENCKLSDGQLRPWFNYIKSEDLVNEGTVRTIYLYDNQYWLEWEADVDVVPAPVAGDTESKIYFTGTGVPLKTNITEATTGSGPMPIGSFPLSVPAPDHAAVATLNPPPDGSGDPRAVAYRWTVLTSWGEESYPSPPSNLVTAHSGEKISLSGMTLEWKASQSYHLNSVVFPVGAEGGTHYHLCVQAGTSGGSEPTWDDDTDDGSAKWKKFKNNLTGKRIYRVATGDQFTNYRFVHGINISETTYDDTTIDSALGIVCPSLTYASGGASDEDWDSPPQTLKGLTYMGNGIMLGFSGKDLYACIPYRPWAWPIAYVQSVPYDIVSISSSGAGNTAIVTTTANPFLVTGTTPGSLSVTRLPEVKPNLSKRGTVNHGVGVIYPASDGLRLVHSDGQTGQLTKDFYDVETWSKLSPDTMHGYLHDNKYFGFYSGETEGCIVVDLTNGDITTLDLYTEAAYVDTKKDTLYFVVHTEEEEEDPTNEVFEWEGDPTQQFPKPYTYKTGSLLLSYRKAFGAARIIFDSQEREDYYTLLEERQRRISLNVKLVSAMQIGGALGENEIGNIEINGDNLEYVFPVGLYSGSDLLTFNLYGDGNLIFTKDVYSTKPFRVPSLTRCRSWEVELVGNIRVRRFDIADSVDELKGIVEE